MTIRSTRIILFLIFSSFFLRGLFLVVTFPIFKGQDESRHYNTIQYLANNKKEDCQNISKLTSNIFLKNNQNKQDLSTYRYSDEIKQTAQLVQNKQVRNNYYDKISFIENSLVGFGEEKFKQEQHSKIQHFCPPDLAMGGLNKDGFSLYHKIFTNIEKIFSAQNIFVRYYFLRIFSVFLGVITLVFAYYIFKNTLFSSQESLFLTAIISFQPKLSIYFTNINYDVLLIPLWTGFVLLSVLIVKNGWSLVRFFFLMFFWWGALFTKLSALPLAVVVLFLLGNSFLRKTRNKTNKNWHQAVVLIAVSIILIIGGYFIFKKIGILSIFSGEYISGLGKYLNSSLSKIYGSSQNYWGVIGWRANNLTLIFVKLIWAMEFLAWLGLGIWLVGSKIKKIIKKIISNRSIFKKKYNFANKIQSIMIKLGGYCQPLNFYKTNNQRIYFWLMLTFIIVLQIAIRMADWIVYVDTGRLTLGTPGRYWLPNIVPHFVLLGLGLKITTGVTKNVKFRQKYFVLSLAIFLLIMILYWNYEVFDVIVPRFYL